MLETLRRTWIALGLAFACVLPATGLAVRDLTRDVWVRCSTSLQITKFPFTSQRTLGLLEDDDRYPPSDFKRIYDTKRDPRDGTPLYTNVRIVERGCDTNNGPPCVCSEIPVAWPADLAGYLGPPYLFLAGDPSNTFYRVLRWPHTEMVVFRRSGPITRFAPKRLFAQRHVPTLMALLALLGLAWAVLRVRRIRRWTEATLLEDDQLVSEAGTALGRLTSTRGLSPGVVLVSPKIVAPELAAPYRDLPMIERRDVAQLRDTRTLVILTTVVAVLGLLVRLVQ